MNKLIELTGKETKQDLINLLLNAGATFECYGLCDAHRFRGDKKPELLRHVKIYNANVAAGGNGNISQWKNPEAHSHREELDERLKKYLYDHGIDHTRIGEMIPQDEGLAAMERWRKYLDDEHNGFIGHTEDEKNKGYQFLENEFKILLKITN